MTRFDTPAGASSPSSAAKKPARHAGKVDAKTEQKDECKLVRVYGVQGNEKRLT